MGRWRERFWATAALAERDARARALGLDPATLPDGPEVFGGARGWATVLYWSTNAAPLPDGSRYRALARFGFRTPERRAAIGRVGAEVPVRVDPADPSRVALDSARLPPVS